MSVPIFDLGPVCNWLVPPLPNRLVAGPVSLPCNTLIPYLSHRWRWRRPCTGTVWLSRLWRRPSALEHCGTAPAACVASSITCSASSRSRRSCWSPSLGASTGTDRGTGVGGASGKATGGQERVPFLCDRHVSIIGGGGSNKKRLKCASCFVVD